MAQRIFSSADFQDPPSRRARSGGPRAAARVVSGLVGLLVVAPALILVMAGGARAYVEGLQLQNSEPVLAAILLLVGGLLLVLIVALSGLLSAFGPAAAGFIATLAGLAFLIDPSLIRALAGRLPAMGVSPEVFLVFWCQSGLLLATGIVLLASSLARIIAYHVPPRVRGGGTRGTVSLIVGVLATPFGFALVALGAIGVMRSFAR